MLIKSLDVLLQYAVQKEESVVSVAVAEDEHVLEAVDRAYALGIAKFVLFGNEELIRAIGKKLNINVDVHDIRNYVVPVEAVQHATKEVACGKAHALMKGLIDTSVVMKAALSKEDGLRTGKKLSHLAVFEVPTYHKIFFVTDAAMNIAPDFDTKKDIIQNAIDAVVKLGIEQPKVALLCAKEKVDEKMPITLEYQELIKLNREGAITKGFVDGPFALDNAVSKESAKIKGITSDVAGDADILMCPNIESANILYKALAFLGNAKNGGVILGAKAPIILTSRADSSESKLLAIALGVVFS